MGKFFDALKKSESPNKPLSPKPDAMKAGKVSPDAVDALRLDTTALQSPAEEPPFPRGGMDTRLASFLEPGSLAAESFKMLRAKLFTRNEGSRPRSIMITSPLPLDGKSTAATNLAINIAQGINEYVMLVDCDLRKPSLAGLLGLNANKGIREYLEEGTSVAPYLVKTPVKKLTLLPAGKPPQNPSELLSSEKMRRLIEEIKARYEDRYIIFDATPTQFAAETTFLASMMDGVILVVRSGKTAKDLVMEAVQNIGSNKILGLVFNASSENHRGYRYYYRYYRK
ncbi:MAG: polysaccharide biosynthesis tyrosine autokinase [Desulfobacterales bacterium]|nr:polysaccharide biosynthesis tyrosine autokinase [Desulfobacterales bacterium]